MPSSPFARIGRTLSRVVEPSRASISSIVAALTVVATVAIALAPSSAHATATAAIAGTVVSSSVAATSGSQLTIGEKVTYEITATLPDSIVSSTTSITVQLPIGMTLVSLDNLTESFSVTMSGPGGLPGALSSAQITSQGRNIVISLPDVQNHDSDGATDEAFVLTLTAVVTNSASNQSGTLLIPSLTFDLSGDVVSGSAGMLTIVEPNVSLAVDASPANADAGDTVTYTLTVTAPSGSSYTAANDIVVTDVLPSTLAYVPGTLTAVSGVSPASMNAAGGTLTINITQLLPGESSVVRFHATPTPVAAPGATVQNTASLTYTSVPGNVSSPQSSYDTASIERTGSGGLNDYAASDSADITIYSNAISGYVYLDLDGSGTHSGADQGISGVSIQLTGTDHLGSPINTSTTTNVSGAYSFTALRPGTYSLAETQPDGYQDGPESVGTGAGGTPGADMFTNLVLAQGANTSAVNFNFAEQAKAELSLKLTGATSSTPVGGNAGFTVEIMNAGPAAALNAAATIVLPEGLSYQSGTSGAWTCTVNSLNAKMRTCTIPVLPAGASSIAFVAQVGTGLASHARLRTLATVMSSGSTDTDSRDNTADASTFVADAGDADLSVTQTIDTPAALVGQGLIYTIEVRNDGPATTDATATITLPPGFGYVGPSGPTSASCVLDTTLVCTLTAMAPGAMESIPLLVNANATGRLPSSVIVSGTAPDPNPTNDQAIAVATISSAGQSDLQVTTSGPPLVVRGERVTYTYVVTNRGPTDAIGAQLSDAVGTEPGISPQGTSGGGCSFLPCSLGVFVAGETRTITSTYLVDPGYAGTTLTNQATLSAISDDPDSMNNSASAPVVVASPSTADVRVTGVDSPDAMVAGRLASYTLVVSNDGPLTATNVNLQSWLPSGYTIQATGTSQGGACSSSSTVSCLLGSIEAGDTAVVALTLQTPTSLPTPNPVEFSATALSAESDPNASNDVLVLTTTVVAQADLQITKTSASTVVAGGSLVYTITVTNAGPSDATNVAVDNPTPAGLTFTSNTGDCTTAFPCASLGTIEAGGTRTITATYAVPSGYASPTSISTTATVSSDAIETNVADNASSPSSTLTFNADLAIDVTGPPTSVSAGGTISYTVTVTNNGPSDTIGVQVANTTPSGLTFASTTGDCTTTFPCSLGALAAGATRTFTATYNVPPAYTTPDPIVNAMTVSSSRTDGTSTNDTDSASTALGPPSADLSVSVVAPAVAIPGNNLTFTITVSNAGPADAAGAALSYPTPGGLTFVSAAGDCVTASPCSLGTIPSGQTRTVEVIWTVPPGYTTPDPIVQTTTVSASTSDAVAANNSVTKEVSVGADLSLTMSAAPEPVVAGERLTYTILATNNGAQSATDLAITNALPAQTTFVSAETDGGGLCVAPAVGGTGTVTCTWSGVTAASVTRRLVLTVRVAAGAAGGTTIANSASTSSQTNDPDSSDNSASATSTVTTAADIVLTMTADNAIPNIDEEVVFTLTARNDGPSDATGVAVTDALPADLTFVSATPSLGAYDSTSGLWTIGALPSGSQATLQLRVRTTTEGSATNLAIKTAGDQIDPNTSNNSAGITLTSLRSADVRVQTTVNTPSANVGDTVTFKVIVSNAGPSDATALRIIDPLPPSLELVEATVTSGAYDPEYGIWELGALALNAEATLTIQARIVYAGTIVNEARKTLQGEHDPNPANDASGATLNGVGADIQVVKTLATTSNVRVGEELVFFITATNNGPSPATGVRVRDLLPEGLAYLSASATQGVYVPQTGVWEIGALAATGPEATATLEVRTSLLTLYAILNRARVISADQPDPNTANNESSVYPPVVSSDLGAIVSVDGNPGQPGTTARFTFDIVNNGDGGSVSPVTVAIPLPPEYDYAPQQTATAAATVTATAAVTAAPAGPEWTCTLVGRVVFCTSQATLAPGAHLSLTLPVQVNETLASGRSLFAYLTTPGGAGVPASVTQQYLGAEPRPDANIWVQQKAQVTAGAGMARTITYTIDIGNQSDTPAEHATLVDVLQAGVTFVSAEGPLGACARNGGYLSCELGTIAPDQLVHVTVVLSATAPGAVLHSVGVTSSQYDSSPEDNFDVLAQKLDLPATTDTDGDGMPDAWESLVGTSVSLDDAGADPDGDGVSNLVEYQQGTHPRGTEHRYFAEGASNDFFTTTIAVLNPDSTFDASVMIELLQADGTLVSVPRLLAPLGRVELDARSLMPAGGTFSVLVESDRPVAVDRDMRWDGSGYGSSGETGTPAAGTTWHFAEGATQPYSLFYLIENPSMTQAADVSLSFLLTGGRPPVVVTDTVAPHSRKTVFVNDLAEAHPSLRGAEVAATVTSTNGVPIVVERAMYRNLPGQPMGAGHAGLGATSLSTTWFFAEGATGTFFKEYLLLANPQQTMTTATVRYLLPDGTWIDKPYDLMPTSRRTIDVSGEDARLAATPVSAMVTATQPIVAERVMWWPGASVSPNWYEAHVSLGATTTGQVWAIAGAASGGPWHEQTYALVANQEAYASQVRVTVTLDDGSSFARTVDLPATSRTTVDFAGTFPEIRGQHFSAVLQSTGDTPAPIVVEWSRYGSPAGQFWGAGSAALATKVQ
jgi:uncharacterized repeat protein (TIGR01451 family)/fimbrial isopeptide formation D2 family protein